MVQLEKEQQGENSSRRGRQGKQKYLNADSESAASRRETLIGLKINKQTIKIHSMANKIVEKNMRQLDKLKASKDHQKFLFEQIHI